MAFENHYPNRKDWRKPYHGGKRYFADCRPHGGCPYYKGKITHKKLKATPADEAAQIMGVVHPAHDLPHRRYMHDKLLHRGDISWEPVEA